MSYRGMIVGTKVYELDDVDKVYLYLMKFPTTTKTVYKIGVALDPKTRRYAHRVFANARFGATASEILFMKEFDKGEILEIENETRKFYKRLKVYGMKEWYFLSDEITNDFAKVVEWVSQWQDVEPQFIANARKTVGKTYKQRQQKEASQ